MTNKRFLVTGATSGIGKVLTRSLLSKGAEVAFCGRSQDKLDAFVAELEMPPEKTFYQAFDANNFAAIEDFVTNAVSKLGNIDVLVNCAGANSVRGGVSALKPEELEAAIRLNCISPFAFVKSVYQQCLAQQGAGKIINVLSTVCQFSNEGIGAYTTSKASFDALTKVFRKEVRNQGIKVCSVYPGGVDTPFREADRPEYLAAEDVVQAILYVAGQGNNVCVDELIVRPQIEKNYP